jgi:DNA-binding CsgD family transcriptional regulator
VDNELKVPERVSLELSFVRARWLAAASVALLALLGGYSALETAALIAVVVLGNLAIRLLATAVTTLTAQRRLGVSAVVFDAAIVFGVGLAADEGSASAVLSALVIVVAEASVRFTPVKALAGAVLLIGGLAAVMGIRRSTAGDPFDPAQFAAISVIVLLVGTVVGSAVREVYRQRVAVEPDARIGPTAAIESKALEALTPRERQVLSLIVRGYSNQRIAEALVVEQKTVKNHINRIYGKLELNSRYEAITSVLGRRAEDEAS